MCELNPCIDRDRAPMRVLPRNSVCLAVALAAILGGYLTPSGALAAEAANPKGGAPPGFLPHQEFSTGAGRAPSAVVLRDLNSDGIPDLAVSVETSATFDSVDVAFGVGDGTFAPFASYGIGSNPTDLVVGDMNRDGHPDLITTNLDSDDISVLLNNGDGTFAPEVFFATGTGPIHCRVADVDSDGFLDIVSVNRDSDTVTIFTNNGTGASYSSNSLPTEFDGLHGRQPYDLVLDDFNNDGAPDIVATSGDNEIVMMYNTGAGSFFTGDFAYYIATGANPLRIQAHDFDNDGWLDVVLGSAATNNLVVHFNDGGSAFPYLGPGTNTATAAWPTGIGLGDHDRDGHVDLVVGLPSIDTLQLFVGNGSGGFTPTASFPVGDWPSSVAVADLDRDGDLDVATGNNDGDSVSILLNRFNILFGPPPVARIDAPTANECLCGSDLVNGVAHVDLGLLDHWTLEYRLTTTDSWTLLTDSITDVPEPGGPLVVWDSSGLAEGRYLLKLTVHSLSGLSATDEVVVWVSRDFDAVGFDFLWGTVGMPSVADFVAGNACPIGSVGDNGCGGVTYTVDYTPSGTGAFTPIDPAMPSYAGGASNSLLGTWDTIATAVPDGPYDVQVVGTNLCGQQKMVTRSVTVDNTPPVAELTAPVSCLVAHPGDLVEIRGTASDANLVGWSVSVIGGPHTNWHTLATGSSSVINGLLATFDTTGLPDCGYVLRLRVTDAAVPNCGSSRRVATEYRAFGIGTDGCMFTDPFEVGSTGHWSLSLPTD